MNESKPCRMSSILWWCAAVALMATSRAAVGASSGADSSCGKFAADVRSPAGREPASFDSGDLDGDSDLDLIIANSINDGGLATFSVLLNQRDGTFILIANYEVAYDPSSISIGDLDGDGDADVVVSAGQGEVSTHLNDGTASFTPGEIHDLVTFVSSTALGDVDSDGDLDLVLAHRSSDTVSVLLNDGMGSFIFEMSYAVRGGPVRVRLADLDRDLDLDLAIPLRDSDEVIVMLNDGDEGSPPRRATPWATPPSTSPSPISTAMRPSTWWSSTLPATTYPFC
jgi:hypothetical protein